MLSLTPRAGAGVRYRAGARALAVTLALAASLAAAPAPRTTPRPAPTSPAAASADPDAALQRLAAETDHIQSSAPDAVARLKSVVRELIAIERAQRREIAMLRAGPSVQRATTVPRRRSRKKSAPSPPQAPPGVVEPSPADSTPAVAQAPPAAGALFGKRGLKKVHRPGCVFGERIKAEDRVYFKSMQEATAAGYEACKICRPGG